MCAHAHSLRFAANRAGAPSGASGVQERLAEEERGQRPLQNEKCRCLTVQGSLAENLSSFPLPRQHTVICNSYLFILSFGS